MHIQKKDLKLPKRDPRSRKGQNGKVLVIGGSKDYVGAVALAALAALRCGVDWVTIVAPEKVGWAINCLSPDLVVKKIKASAFRKTHVKKIIDKIEPSHDIVLIGNGIGLESRDFVIHYIKKTTKPLVIDADAIKSISIDMVDQAIITPHKKELQILMHNSGIHSMVRLRESLRDNVILLKGKTDEIITKNRVFYNRTGNAGMTKAGTGDVLAGLAAGFYAQLKDNLESAKDAAYFNGKIGEILAKKKKGFTYLASDMVEEINRIR